VAGGVISLSRNENLTLCVSTEYRLELLEFLCRNIEKGVSETESLEIQAAKKQMLCFDAFSMLFPAISKHLIFGASNFFARYQQLIRINKEK